MIFHRKLMTCLACLALGALVMSDASSAEERPADRTVSVSAAGSVNAAPDIGTISTGVATEGSTAREALDANNKAMGALIDGLKAIGLPAQDIQTTNIGVEPRYQTFKDGRPPAVTGYRVVNQIRIVLRNIAKLGETLDRSISLGANQLGGIRFDVSTIETAKDDARRQAMANAQRRARLYAEAAGARLGDVLTISETLSQVGPRPQPMVRAAMAASVPIEAGAQTLEVTVYVTWAMK
jgi:uncharacterized protein YggE